ncbi:hypothetical protein SDC9_182073 [bioreactor metagenome]|uniref:Uncharacterized protein n=1 Tax=bioreactor metagenome TaxID=1076179 RepID=A0A645H909_9ZZZZ
MVLKVSASSFNSSLDPVTFNLVSSASTDIVLTVSVISAIGDSIFLLALDIINVIINKDTRFTAIKILVRVII